MKKVKAAIKKANLNIKKLVRKDRPADVVSWIIADAIASAKSNPKPGIAQSR